MVDQLIGGDVCVPMHLVGENTNKGGNGGKFCKAIFIISFLSSRVPVGETPAGGEKTPTRAS
jgi:hypothetical protein